MAPVACSILGRMTDGRATSATGSLQHAAEPHVYAVSTEADGAVSSHTEVPAHIIEMRIPTIFTHPQSPEPR